MMKKTLVLICCCLFSLLSFGQSKNRLDSLKGTLKTSSLVERANNYNRISAIYINSNLDSAIKYADLSIALATKNNLYSQLASGHNFMGQAMYYKSNYNASFANFEKFKAAAILAKDDQLIAQAINAQANVLIDRGKTTEAIQKYEEVLALSKKRNDLGGLSLGYGNLAYAYRYMGNYTKAIEYVFQQIKVDEQTKNNNGLGHAYQQLALLFNQKNDLENTKKYIELSIDKFKELNDGRNVAVSYDLYSTYYLNVKDPKKALEYEKMAIALAEKYADKRSLSIFQSKIGHLYFENKLYEQAEKPFQAAIKMFEEIKLQKNLAALYIGYGRTLTYLNRKEEAKSYLDKGLAIALQQRSATDKRNAYQGLTVYYTIYGDPEKALQSQADFVELNDSLLNETNSKQLNELNTIYQTEKKEQRIQLLDKQNQIQSLELDKNELALTNKNLELDKSNLMIEGQKLSLQKNNILLSQKQAEALAKEQKIKLLNTENQLQKAEVQKRNIVLGITIGILLILCLLGYLFYNRYKLRQEARLQQEVIIQQDLSTKAVLNAEENERKRISGELHDGLGQLFSAVKMNLSALTEDLNFKSEHSKTMFDKTLNMVDESCKEVRVISHQMAPNVLLKSGLTAAVRDFISKIDNRKLKINLETFGLQERLDQNIETVLYRVIQETVNNVIKHSGANSLDIQLNKDEEGINVMIEDNGKGFEASQLDKFEGIGLKNIRTRINYLKGTVDFSSKPGEGTLIAIFIPF